MVKTDQYKYLGGSERHRFRVAARGIAVRVVKGAFVWI